VIPWEWVQDCWHADYTGAPVDGSAWEEGDGSDCARRLLRGGSWGGGPRDLRSASRCWNGTVNRDGGVGSRLAQDM